MALFSAFSRRLYLRIWLAVVGGVAALALVVGWAWRVAVQYNAPAPAPREVMVRNLAGELIGSAQAQPGRQPGQPLEFTVNLNDGQTLILQMPPRNRRMGGGPPPPPAPYWTRPPYGFFWMLGVVGLAVALGIYPIVRRLTQRLEALQRGVQRWGDGDLSVRVPITGQDEVADLAQRFNAAAERIQTLMASQQALLASQKSLLANASHELRSPLTRIRMGLELLGEQGPAGALWAARKKEISRNIGELDQLIDEILLASRLDAREADIGTVEPVDLLGLAAEESARAGAELQLPDGAEALVVPGVAKLLRRLVRNLLENARRHGGRGGQAEGIAVILRREPGWVVLQVCDRGPGVPPAQRERIFEPFYRLPGASEREGGVGLGLSLVRSIAQRHGGSVHCEDREGGGARFSVRLPPARV
ncbi:HAMP domain-containing sensor histidine kinase [Ramlibacter sp. 2FC]|uniref:sensor histidine kinase n=1 Tax=Ramlibacter sp. 2FC TaxID=2502188 RepID=UPI0010F9267C|nr:HAMP domain-containing sensor histidine kinase [Ramlibacter sp. 2FC]